MLLYASRFEEYYGQKLEIRTLDAWKSLFTEPSPEF